MNQDVFGKNSLMLSSSLTSHTSVDCSRVPKASQTRAKKYAQSGVETLGIPAEGAAHLGGIVFVNPPPTHTHTHLASIRMWGPLK